MHSVARSLTEGEFALPCLDLMVLQLLGGEGSGASINDVCSQIQGWVPAFPASWG